MVILMTAVRLDFKRLRSEADFAVVLGAYNIVLAKDGTRPSQSKALCPFHEDKNPSLKVNTDKNIYHCFVCGAKGNILDFVMAMDGIEIRPAAKKVASLCGLAADDTTPVSGKKKPVSQQRPVSAPPPATPETPGELPAALPPEPNKPLSFALKLEHPVEFMDWLAQRGIDAAAVERFGLGLVSSKSKSIGGRLAIPLHDQAGQLVAYCGRHVGDVVPDDVPKYILPKGFRKDVEVFNLHRYPAEPTTKRFVVLFESFFSVMRHAAHVHAVTAMGRSISPEQIELLRKANISRILVAFDGDEPGRTGAREVVSQLAPHFWTRIVDMPTGVKPHHLAWDDLRPLLVEVW